MKNLKGEMERRKREGRRNERREGGRGQRWEGCMNLNGHLNVSCLILCQGRSHQF